MVKIRLTQTGTKNRKMYRIIAIEERERRNGKPIEELGFYNPLVKPPALTVDRERVSYWLKNGAQLSTGAKAILG